MSAVAWAYGLTSAEYERMLFAEPSTGADDRPDPRGFWRVDRELPIECRLTTLALDRFRAFEGLSAEGVEACLRDRLEGV